MNTIEVVVRWFNVPRDGEEWNKLRTMLESHRVVIRHTTDQSLKVPRAGVATVCATDYAYLMDDLTEIFDCLVFNNRHTYDGYYLDLPKGCMPAPADPDAPPLRLVGPSKMNAAIEWLQAAPGRRQSEAARLFDVAQGNISVTLRRRRAARANGR